MRVKYLAFFVGLVFTTNAWAQHPSQSFTELNLGVATLSGYADDIFPGGSLLIGMTRQQADNFVVEVQAGVAFPTYATAKIGGGVGSLNNNVMLSLRPYPFAVGPQIKRNNWTYSLEFGTTSGDWENGTIATVGYRMSLGQQEKTSDDGVLAKSLKTVTAAAIAGLFVGGSMSLDY